MMLVMTIAALTILGVCSLYLCASREFNEGLSGYLSLFPTFVICLVIILDVVYFKTYHWPQLIQETPMPFLLLIWMYTLLLLRRSVLTLSIAIAGRRGKETAELSRKLQSL